MVKDPKVIKALDELDIDRADHKHLSDILDPDKSGDITVLELVTGLKRLRGEPKRSDIISIHLMIRSLHERVDEVLHEVKIWRRSMRSSRREDVRGSKLSPKAS